jgi:sodium/potassium-transporting ATPase subunit alpha
MFDPYQKVDNSSLTGESEAQERKATTEKLSPMEADNLAFYGTLVVSGEGYGVVIRTGSKTVLGQIANLAGGDKKMQSPLNHEIETIVKIIAVAAISMGLIFFTIGMIIKPLFMPNFIFFIGIFVANIPQGLPATVTVCIIETF